MKEILPSDEALKEFMKSDPRFYSQLEKYYNTQIIPLDNLNQIYLDFFIFINNVSIREFSPIRKNYLFVKDSIGNSRFLFEMFYQNTLNGSLSYLLKNKQFLFGKVIPFQGLWDIFREVDDPPSEVIKLLDYGPAFKGKVKPNKSSEGLGGVLSLPKYENLEGAVSFSEE